MGKMRNRIVSVLAAVCLAAACLAGFGAERAAADLPAVSYMYYDPSEGMFKTGSCTEYVTMNQNSTSLSNKWYVVDEVIDMDWAITVNGTVNMILTDRGKLRVSDGISVCEGNTLNIFGQGGTQEGQLIVEAYRSSDTAGIGGRYSDVQGVKNCGTITIHGGQVTAKGASHAAAIGGGSGGSGGTINIYGGQVTTRAGIGIGAGYDGSPGNITIGLSRPGDYIDVTGGYYMGPVSFVQGKVPYVNWTTTRAYYNSENDNNIHGMKITAPNKLFTSDFNISQIKSGDVIDATSGPVTVTNDIPYATSFYGIDIAIYRDETDKDVVNVRPNLHYTFNGKKFTCVSVSSDRDLYKFKPDSFPTDGTYNIYVEGGVAKVDGTEVPSAATGTEVKLTANPATEGQQFYGWEVKSSAWLRDNNSLNNACFYMPQNEVRVKAIYGPAARNNSMFTFYPAAAGTAEFRDNYDGTYVIKPLPLTQGYSVAYYTYMLDGTAYSSRNSGTLPFSYNPDWDPMTFNAPNTLADIEVYCAADISITNGSASVNSSAVTNALPGETVTITAQMPEGQTFLKWTTNTPGVTFADASSATTTFTMPEVPVTIKALPAVGAVTLDKTNETVDIGSSFTINATVTPDDTPDKTVTWSVDRADIASVENGAVTGVKGGTAVVTATAGSKSATCTITVPKEALDLSLSIEGWQQGGQAKQPVLTGNEGNGTVTVEYKEKDADDSTYVGEVPSNAGIYTVRITVDETEHYLGGTATADFEITSPEPDPVQPAAPVNKPATEYYIEPKPQKTPEKIYKAASAVRSVNKQKLDSGLGVTQNNGELTISWGEVPDAEYYEVYVTYLSVPFEKVEPIEIKGANGLETKKINGKAIDSTKNFKLMVEAFKTEDGKKLQLGKSLTLYVAGENNQDYTNVSEVSVNKTKKTLAAGKTFKLKAETILEDMTKKLLKPSAARLRYESSDTSVAKVSSKGKVTAVGKGTCYIRVFALSGASAQVKITVK